MAERVKVNLKPLERFAKSIGDDLRLRGRGPIRDALRQWAARYRGYTRQRFVNNSKGGGDWKQLRPSTIARRRKGERVQGRRRTSASQKILEQRGGLSVAVGGVAILRDTNTLFAAMDPQPGKPGSIEQDIPFGIRVGYGGPHRHPSGKATIADIALFHQTGVPGRMPARPIIVEPDKRVIAGMADDMQRAMNRMLREGHGAA